MHNANSTSVASGPNTHNVRPIGSAMAYIVGCALSMPNPLGSQPPIISFTNDGIAPASIGQFQSCRSDGIPFTVTNAAKTAPAAIAASLGSARSLRGCGFFRGALQERGNDAIEAGAYGQRFGDGAEREAGARH